MSASGDEAFRPPPRDELDRAAFGWWPDPKQLPLRSLVVDDYQLIFNEDAPGRDELYDLAADPMAQHDLAADRPELVARLRALGDRGMLLNQQDRTTNADADLVLDPEIREELRVLGYEN